MGKKSACITCIGKSDAKLIISSIFLCKAEKDVEKVLLLVLTVCLIACSIKQNKEEPNYWYNLCF